MGGTWGVTGIITPTELGGGSSTNNYAPTGHATATIWRISSAGNATLTGMAGGVSGRRVLLVNIGDYTITILDDSASSTAGNRFRTNATGEQITENGAVEVWYDGTSSRWRCLTPTV